LPRQRPATVYCRPTVASFPISPKPDPLFSINSVASFLKSSQLSAVSPTPDIFLAHLKFAICLLPLAILPSCSLPSPPNGGFVPGFSRARSFVFNQLGGFVFEKALSFQSSAVQLPAIFLLPFALCHLPFAI